MDRSIFFPLWCVFSSELIDLFAQFLYALCSREDGGTLLIRFSTSTFLETQER